MEERRPHLDSLRFVRDGTSADEFAWDLAAQLHFGQPYRLRARVFRLLLAGATLHVLAEIPEDSRLPRVRDLTHFLVATPPGRLERQLTRSRSAEVRGRACRVWHRGADRSLVRSELAHLRIVLYSTAVDDG